MEIKECASLEEVREQIDRIDSQIIALIAERGHYALQTANFKTKGHVRDLAREEIVVKKVRARAKECGANQDLVESFYRLMISRFVMLEEAKIEREERG